MGHPTFNFARESVRKQAALGIIGASSILLSLALSLHSELLRQDAMPWQHS